jgi:selenocysteine lyase/cysteine desulfurase
MVTAPVARGEGSAAVQGTAARVVRPTPATDPAYAATGQLDALRTAEYARLDAQGQVYLDYTGGSLYAERQLREHLDLLRNGVFGNPHSDNPTSRTATDHMDAARAAVLGYFQATADEYTAVFTANASGALKLVGEAYPFAPDGRLLLSADNHNSVNGLREFARRAGTPFTYLPLVAPALRLDGAATESALSAPPTSGPRLLAYPAQSNFSGVQHPLEWIDAAHARGWDVLLDAAAFVPTNRLDLRRHRPDFVSLSFYKMVGYPTGIGCLLARREALARLRRPWFAGGAVLAASVGGDGHFLAPAEAGFEDGTVNYLGLPAVSIGLRHLAAVGIDAVHARVACLTRWLLDELLALHHANDAPLVRLYGPADTERRGGTVALNFLDPAGRVVDDRVVTPLARARGISLRTGCFCNPGAAEAAFGVSTSLMRRVFANAEFPGRDRLLAAMGLESDGAVRVSFGIASNAADAQAFVDFARSFLDVTPSSARLPARGHV